MGSKVQNSTVLSQTTRKCRKCQNHRSSMTKSLLMLFPCLLISCFSLALIVAAGAQEDTLNVQNEGLGVAPNVIRWSGSLPEYAGKTIKVQFLLYRDVEGGEALWSETQQITVQSDGRYDVLLGATSPEGISKTLFWDGEAHWLAVQPVNRQQSENNLDEDRAVDAAATRFATRVLLSPAAYAFESMDSAMLAGRPASEYITREDMNQALTQQKAGTQSELLISPGRLLSVEPIGNPGSIPIWTSSMKLGNSVLSESGSNIGIANLNPVTPLDVNGSSTFRGEVDVLAPAASTSGGANSPPLQLQASTYSSTSHISVPQSFAWQALSAGNNTSSPTANLSLLFGSETGLTPTGLSIAPNGIITFASGQTFPGMNNLGSGSGTVNIGTTGQIAYYASNGNAVGSLNTLPVTAGGTGASDAARALANLGAMPLTGGAFTGTLSGTSASLSGTLLAGTTLPAGAPAGTVGAAQIYSPRGEFDPYAFGAKGDDSTDDTAAIQSALDAAGSLGGAMVRLRPGKYKISSPLQIPVGVFFFGSGDSWCRSNSGNGANSGTCIHYTGSSGAAISLDVSSGGGRWNQLNGFTVWGSDSGDNCINLKGNSDLSVQSVSISNVQCSNFGNTGIYANGISYLSLERVSAGCYGRTTNGKIGIDLERVGTLYQEVSRFEDVNTQGCIQYGMKIGSADTMYFDKLDLNDSGVSNLLLAPSSSNNSLFDLFFYNTDLVRAGQNGIELDSSQGYNNRIHFVNTIVSLKGNSPSERAIYAHGSGYSNWAEFNGYEFNSLGGTTSTYHVVADGSSTLQMENPMATTYNYSLSTPNAPYVFQTGAQAPSFVSTGTSTFNTIRDLSLTHSGGLLYDAGSNYIGETTSIPNGATAITQSAGDNSTKIATTAYVDTKTIEAQGGGTGINSGSSTGVAQVNSGTWIVSPVLANGTTAKTQFAGDDSMLVATTAYVASPGAITPTTVTARGLIAGGNDATNTTPLTMANTWTTMDLVMPTVPVNTTKSGHCTIFWQMSSTSYAATFGLGMDNAPTNVWGGTRAIYSSVGDSNWFPFSQSNTTITAISPATMARTAGTTYPVYIDFVVETGSTNPVTMALYGQTSDASATLTIMPGSTCYWLP